MGKNLFKIQGYGTKACANGHGTASSYGRVALCAEFRPIGALRRRVGI